MKKPAGKAAHQFATRELGKTLGDLMRSGYGLRRAANTLGIRRGHLNRWLALDPSVEDDRTTAELDFAREVNTAVEDIARSTDALNRLARGRIAEEISLEGPSAVKVAQWQLERADPEYKSNSAPISVDATLNTRTVEELMREYEDLRRENEK